MSIENKFIYYPVSPETNSKALELTDNYFDNGIRSLSSRKIDKSLGKDRFCDSGGLQAFRAIEQGKIVIVDPELKTNINDPDLFILGTSFQCEEYAHRKLPKAMLIDLPTRIDDDDLSYHWKLVQSRKARDQLLRWAEYYCPETRLGIVLQPRNPIEIKNYFCSIFTPKVDIYAFPVRNFRNAPADALGNAYVLSFLSEMGIRHIHFLGSNAPVIIFLLAKAIALNMFKMASFDSLTWNQPAVSRALKYLHPHILTPMPKKGSLHPNTNLRTELAQYTGVFEATIGRFNPPEWVIAKEWCGIYNIKAIEEFKNTVLSVAMDNNLNYFLKRFEKYGQGNKGKIIKALDLLDESKDFGHEYIEQKYGSIIEELYC